MRPPSSTTSGTRCAGIAALANQQVGDERAALEHRVRRLDAANLDVLVESIGAESDGEDRNGLRAQRQQLVADRRARVVGAVGQHDEPRERHARPAPAAPVRSRRPGASAFASNVRLRGAVDSLRAGRKAEQADDELLPERLEQRAVRPAERVLDPVAARLAVLIGHPHAARVVDQHADVVPLRHGGRQQQHRPEQTADQHHERRDAQARRAPSDRASCSCRARRRSSAPPARRRPPTTSSSTTTENGAPKAKLPLANSVGRYLNRN